MRGLLLAWLCAVALLAGAPAAAAQTPAFELRGDLPAIALWSGRAPGALGEGADDQPSITPFLPAAGRAAGTAVLVFPGGGYGHLSLDREGAQVARWLNSVGVTAFVVRYRLGPRYHHPVMMQDAQRAVRLVRARAATWSVNPARIGVIGFSAGGHLASTAGTHFVAGTAASEDPIERVGSRPDFQLLVYPVITMDGPFVHRGSRKNLLGEQPTPELVRLMSNETQVTRETPPTLLIASTDDATVPVENSLMFYQALKAAAVPVELHVYESGKHGFGLAAGDAALSGWLGQGEAWLRRHGWVLPAPTR